MEQRIPVESCAVTRAATSPRLRAGSDGVALVVTLCFLLITVGIMLAFLVRARHDVSASASYTASVQSDLLAAGALDQVAASFLDEITDTKNSLSHSANGLTWFEPMERNLIFPSMVPERSVADDVPTGPAYRNLIKQSTTDRPFFAGAHATASDLPADHVSRNGRGVSSRRWALPMLLGDDEGVIEDAPVPDWVYVRENGETTREGDDVIGRYAFNVYDVGGLLNLNVAGHASGIPSAEVAAKGSVMLADLSRIPGMTPGAVDACLAWRSPQVAWNKAWEIREEIPAGHLSPLDFLRLGSASGWMRNPAFGSEKGNQILSRRDLIRLFHDRGLPTTPLPYFTHFSVEADAPSFSPPTNLLKVETGRIKESRQGSADVSQIQDQINPQRFEEAVEVDLGNGRTEAAPALRRRFPLSRLASVSTNASARPVRWEEVAAESFGLVAEDGQTWQYRDPENGEDHIKRLSEIPAGREPNFFEILKSVIHVGSLGQYKNTIADDPNDCLEPRADRIDEHILRIGAAIIDQADADSEPTRILFNDDGEGTSFGEIYGVEDLPYLHFLRFVAYRTFYNPNDPTSESWRRAYMIQPNLWNPHNPLRSNHGGSPPQEFRVVARSTDGPLVVHSTNEGKSAVPESGWEQISGKNFNPEADQLLFNWNPKDENFRHTQGLLSTEYPRNAVQGGSPSVQIATIEGSRVALSEGSGLAAPAINNTGSLAGWSSQASTSEESLFAGTGPYTTTGFHVGSITVEPPRPINDWKQLPSAPVFAGGPVEFLLQYRPAGGGEFRTYDRIWFNPTRASLAVIVDKVATARNFRGVYQGRRLPLEKNTSSGSANYQRFDMIYLKSDPRSQRFLWGSPNVRFSSNTLDNWQYGAELTVPERLGPTWMDGMYGGMFADCFEGLQTKWWTMNTPVRQTQAFDGDFGTTTPRQRPDLGYLSINRPLPQSFSYEDHDGVTRPAMAAKVANVPKSLPPVWTRGGWGQYGLGGMNYRLPAWARRSKLLGLPMQTTLLASGAPDPSTYDSRPIVLNRPFRSVGELAYAFRDVPWKNVDFAFPESGDTGLLDAFCVYENNGQDGAVTPKVAGRVNLNTCSQPVLEALLAGAATRIASGTQPALVPDDVTALAQRILDYRDPAAGSSTSDRNGPLRSLAELTGRAKDASGTFVGLDAGSVASTAEDRVLQENLSIAARSLADAGSVRSWNVMIDLVAQSGRIRGKSAALEDFSVSSESRWWLFLSIDRFTGKILSRSLERVVE